ncbi:MAG TPA: Chromate resistance protein ChrB [Methanocella sp.]|uniref:Chromate resistance protein ChrB n=1 Tax=Methanocella sp. TaxID=2052833 RepID=UPI002C73635B|nr:Chromate resistance protein ChrB [Methanocella sp.]HTY91782.1 Chromate resistance protein ChrB [Methanocella sp.]
MDDTKCLLLLTQLPQTPSSTRVTVWRQMKASGGVSVQNNAWVLPNSARNEEFLNKMRSFVQARGGRAFIFTVKGLDTDSANSIMETFNSSIDRDYTEFFDGCKALLSEIKKETKLKKFNFSGLDEIEEDMQKLTSWLRKIKARDFFKSPKCDSADALIGQCRKELQAFEKAVYANEGLEIPDDAGSS